MHQSWTPRVMIGLAEIRISREERGWSLIANTPDETRAKIRRKSSRKPASRELGETFSVLNSAHVEEITRKPFVLRATVLHPIKY